MILRPDCLKQYNIALSWKSTTRVRDHRSREGTNSPEEQYPLRTARRGEGWGCTGDACPQCANEILNCGPHNRSLSLIVVRSDAETAFKGLRLWLPPNVEYEKSVG